MTVSVYYKVGMQCMPYVDGQHVRFVAKILVEATEPEAAACMVFQILNSEDCPHPVPRSMCVGDVLKVDGRFYACDPTAWRLLDAPPRIILSPIAESIAPKFPMGQLLATPGAVEACDEAEQTPLEFFAHHVRGDWGEVCKDDFEENELSLREGFRLMSVYHTTKGTKVWVITEADRSVTTLLLPEEY